MATVWTATASGLFVVVAVAHSTLGERELVRPLLAQEWSTQIPRWGAERLIRFAWHLTTIAWLGLAAITVGVEVATTVGVVALVSAIWVAVMLRAHFAWALFLIAAFATGVHSGWLTDQRLRGLAWVGVATLALAAGLHLYWAAGGTRAGDTVLPTDAEGTKPFVPGPGMTAAVAGALLTLAAAITALLTRATPPTIATWVVTGGVVALTARAIGDGRYAGFFKSVRSTRFARNDDRIFTPLAVLLALMGLSALVQ